MTRGLQGILAVLLVSIHPALAAPEPARRADDFVDRIGVATHWGYPDTPYGYAYEEVKKLLGESGIRHVRDGYHARLKDLYQTYGIKATLIYGPQWKSMDAIVANLKDNLDLVDMVEGPNEVDIFASSANWQGKTFPAGPIAFQNELYAALKGDPATKHIGVIAPSTARMDSNLKLAPLASLDYTVMHSYAGGGSPEASLEGGYVSNILNAGRTLGQGAVLKPIVVTESGYHTALEGGGGVIAGVQPAVSEKAQAKYLPRHFAAYFNAGIVRTIVYEFINEFQNEATNAEASFGLVRRDLTPKPAYTALKNLIGLLSEATWNATAQRWESGPGRLAVTTWNAAEQRWETKPFAPRALDFELSGDANQMKHLRHTLLQKSDGDFYLLLWQEISSFDTKTRKDIANPDAPVTLTIKTPLAAAATTYLPGQILPELIWSKPQQLKLSVPDEVLVVKLTPAPPRSTTVPAPPTNLNATATGDTIMLSWDAAPIRAGVQGYFVTRLGRYLGRADGTHFTDARLLPNTGYTYEIQSYDAAGNVSPPATKVVMTKNELPDLVVTDFAWTPATPKAGEPVSFSVTIKNIGTGPTPAGVTHGIAFEVDGANVNWSDTFNGPLAPGESKTLTANNGPIGTATWLTTPGTHRLTAHLDDLNRINESDETNNKLDKTVDIAAP